MLLYDNMDNEVMTMTFNATGATKDTWFSLDRLISSPYIDLVAANVLSFSLEGFVQLFYT